MLIFFENLEFKKKNFFLEISIFLESFYTHSYLLIQIRKYLNFDHQLAYFQTFFLNLRILENLNFFFRESFYFNTHLYLLIQIPKYLNFDYQMTFFNLFSEYPKPLDLLLQTH